MKYEEWLVSVVPGYQPVGGFGSLAEEAWHYQQKRIDWLENKLESLGPCGEKCDSANDEHHMTCIGMWSNYDR